MARKLATVVFSLGCLHASSLMALGLGEIELDSFLNEPLNASVDLLNVGSLHQDEIKVRLATREDFERMGLERAFFLTNIEFEVVMDSKGRGHIKMSSDEPVLEPYLDFLVEARWPSGRLLREYTVLIDPPVFAESSNVVSASKRVEEVEGIPAPAKKKSAGSNGTSVNLKKSNLAPGSMPQRDYNAAAAGSPSSGSRYMISRDDTLWTIASRAQPEGVSVYQTMLEIQRLNPNAFINGNINRVKAGYIIYLPTADDVSSGDPAAALAEVNEQNAAWREQRDAELYASRGPKLKISAEPGDAGTPDSVGGSSTGGMTSGLEDAMGSSQAGGDNSGQLAAMQQQLETMQRIVNLKDEQIAALQNALTETEESPQDVGESADLEALEAATEAAAQESDNIAGALDGSDLGQGSEQIIDAMESTAESVGEDVDSAAQDAAEKAAAAAAALKAEEAEKPKKPSKPKITTKPLPAEPATNWLMYGLYALGGLVVAGLAFLFVRRRRDVEDDFEEEVIADDVFSDVELQEQELEVEDFDETDLEDDLPLAASGAAEDKQGYGGHRHDEYASDVEASDALAEADIYIAYGRHPQAIDLLNNALSNEPNNPVYRLKLIEVYTELGDRGAAAAQLEQLQSLGNAEATAQGEAIYNNEPSSDNFEAQVGAGGAAAADLGDEFDELLDEDQGGPGLTPNPLSIDDRLDDGLENEFSGLEIEDADDEGELDLSSDFEPAGGDDDEEELVIAADANGLSTKMDLARAYIDMGDEDGARQILEEVVSEGSDELRLEAETLLDRLGG